MPHARRGVPFVTLVVVAALPLAAARADDLTPVEAEVMRTLESIAKGEHEHLALTGAGKLPGEARFGSLADLVAAKLVDERLWAGRVRGFRVAAGVSPGAPAERFWATAVPGDAETGKRSFFVNQKGVVTLVASATLEIDPETCEPRNVAPHERERPRVPEVTPARTVEAQAFVLKDANGRIQATLSLTDAGRPRLALFDGDRIRLEVLLAPDGSPRIDLQGQKHGVQIDASSRSAGIAVVDSRGVPRIWTIYDGAHDTASIYLIAGNKKPLLDLSCSQRDSGLTAYDRDTGARRATFGINSNLVPRLGLYDRKGTRRVYAVLEPDGAPSLELLDAGEKPVFRKP